MADDDSLLDIFVNIKPRFDQNFDAMVEAAMQRLKDKFINVKLPPINIATPASSGGGGGGRSAGSGIANEFRDAKRAAEDLQIRLRQVGELTKEIGDGPLSKSFSLVAKDLSDIQLQLRRSKEDDDPLGLQATIQRLDVISSRIDSIQTQGSQRRANRSIFERLTVEDTSLRTGFNVESSLRQQAVQGLSSDQRETLLRGSADIKLQEAAVLAAKRAFDGSTESLDRYIAELLKLNGVTDVTTDALQRMGRQLDDPTGDITGGGKGLRGLQLDLQQTARVAGSSFNNLSNNGYQAGQAIEDFAVGFSLNGVAGGIRGAANNVAFILNDMARLPQVTNLATAAIQKMKPALPAKEAAALGARFAEMIPFAAGIGSALAILVLPRMVEWVQSLIEVDFSLKDISERIKQMSGDAKFALGQELGSEEFERTLKSAASVESILSEIEKKSINKDKNIREMQTQFESLSASGAIKDVIAQMVELNKVASEDILVLTNRKAITLGPLAEINEQLKAAEERKGVIRDVVVDLTAAQNAVSAGTPDQVEKVTKLNETWRKLSETVKGLAESTSGTRKFFTSPINGDDVEKLVEKFGVLSPIVEQLNKDSLELKEITETNIIQGFDAILEKSKELAFGIRLVQAEIKGMIFEGASEIDALFIKNEKIRESISDTLKLAISQTDPTVKQRGVSAAAAAKDTQSGLFLNELGQLLKKSQEELKKLDEKNKKSTFTNFDDFVKKLQTNVLSSDDKLIKSQEDLAKKIELLTEVIRIEKANPGGTGIDSLRGGFSVPSAQDFREIEASSFKEAMRELLNPLGKIESAAKETAAAVRDKDTTAKAAP